MAAGDVCKMELIYFSFKKFHDEVFASCRTFSLANSNKNKVCFVCDINKCPQEFAWAPSLNGCRLSQKERIMYLDLIAPLPK